jgi:hypothetical protein
MLSRVGKAKDNRIALSKSLFQKRIQLLSRITGRQICDEGREASFHHYSPTLTSLTVFPVPATQL